MSRFDSIIEIISPLVACCAILYSQYKYVSAMSFYVSVFKVKSTHMITFRMPLSSIVNLTVASCLTMILEIELQFVKANSIPTWFGSVPFLKGCFTMIYNCPPWAIMWHLYEQCSCLQVGSAVIKKCKLSLATKCVAW